MNNQKKQKTRVEIKRWPDLSISDLRSSFSFFGISTSIENAKKILVKVNLAAGDHHLPETAVVTNPKILLLLINTLMDINPSVKISICESDSTGRGFAVNKFKYQKYPELFSHMPNVELFDLSHTPVDVVACNGDFFREGIILSKIFNEGDFFISLGKIKTHINTVITGCLKNQFGCLPEWDKEKYHPYLNSVIADINSAIPPDFCVLEGCPAMEGNGPVNGTVRDIGVVLLGEDPVAVDATAARIMGFNPKRIKMLTDAERAGVGVWQEEKILLYGVPLSEVSCKFNYISPEQSFYISIGFFIQRTGDFLQKFGHKVHLIESTLWALAKLWNKFVKKKSINNRNNAKTI